MPDSAPDTSTDYSPDGSSNDTSIENGAGTAPDEASANLKKTADDLAEEDGLGVGDGEMMAGADTMDAAQEVMESATAAAMMAAADLTRAVDAEIIADRLATLSQVIGVAGVNDIEQGAALIAASDDVDAVSAAIGLMTVDDLDKGLELGRMSGELQILASIVQDLEMPGLSSVLSERAERLTAIAKETIVRAAASRSLTELMEATGKRISDLGIDELDEDALRMAASDIAADRSAELTAAGLTLGLAPVVGMGIAAHSEDLAAAIEEMDVEGTDVKETDVEETDGEDVSDEDIADGAAAMSTAAAEEEDADTSDEETLHE